MQSRHRQLLPPLAKTSLRLLLRKQFFIQTQIQQSAQPFPPQARRDTGISPSDRDGSEPAQQYDAQIVARPANATKRRLQSSSGARHTMRALRLIARIRHAAAPQRYGPRNSSARRAAIVSLSGAAHAYTSSIFTPTASTQAETKIRESSAIIVIQRLYGIKSGAGHRAILVSSLLHHLRQMRAASYGVRRIRLRATRNLTLSAGPAEYLFQSDPGKSLGLP